MDIKSKRYGHTPRVWWTAHDLDQRARERLFAKEIAAASPSEDDVRRRPISSQIGNTTGAGRVLFTAGELLLAMGVLIMGPLVVPSVMVTLSGGWPIGWLFLLVGPGAIMIGGLVAEAGLTRARRDVETGPPPPQPRHNSAVDRERLVRQAQYYN